MISEHQNPRALFPSLTNTNNLPQAGRVQFCLPKWKEITRDCWILRAVQGYKIPFTRLPPPTHLPPFSFNQEEVRIISEEVQSLLKKGAVQRSGLGIGFTSNIFLIPKTGGRFRLILNLKALNNFVAYEHSSRWRTFVV